MDTRDYNLVGAGDVSEQPIPIQMVTESDWPQWRAAAGAIPNKWIDNVQFFPKQAEICGPVFTPDNKTLFLAIQHPGDDFRKPYTDRSTRWPDFNERLPPRSSFVVVTKNDGDVIGG